MKFVDPSDLDVSSPLMFALCFSYATCVVVLLIGWLALCFAVTPLMIPLPAFALIAWKGVRR